MALRWRELQVVLRGVKNIESQDAAADFWVFGYGSLMWRAGFEFIEQRRARLYGYHRAFCVASIVHRGTPERPGLVLGLDRGGSCRGVGFRVADRLRTETLAYLHEREMIRNVYHPRWVPLHLDCGRMVLAYAFVVDRVHEGYRSLAAGEAAAIIARGHGQRGSNLDYLTNTVAILERMGIKDDGLKALCQAATRHHRES